MNGIFLKEDIKRAVINKGFILGVLLLFAVFTNAVLKNETLDGSESTYEIIATAMALSGFTPFAAIFPVLSYSGSFCEEYRSGYLRMVLTRMGWKEYGRCRILSTALSGGLIMAIPFTILCIVSYWNGTPGLPQNGMYADMKMEMYLLIYGDWYILLGKILLGFLFGVLWALIGMAFAVWSVNQYVAMIAPFVLYQLMWILLARVPVLNPIYLVRGDDLQSYPLSGLMELFYIFWTVVIIWIGLRRRTVDE